MRRYLHPLVLACGVGVLLAPAAAKAAPAAAADPKAAPPAAIAATAAAAGADVPAGKQKTDQTISLEVTVEASPAEVYRLWTTSEGVKKFIAPAAEIDPVVGGRYQVAFDPASDPDGKAYGTYACKILRLEPNHLVAFEWTFPPLGAELNTQPFPTWVEVRIDPVPGQPGQSVVHLQHFGFPHSEKWDKAFAVFRDRNWPHVLATLKGYCHQQAQKPAQ